METYEFTGIHFLASYSGCRTNLSNVEQLKIELKRAVESSGATILGQIDHIFESQCFPPENGYTSVFVLSESHASIHTYPDKHACFVDLFTCGDKCSYVPFDSILKNYLQPSAVSYQVIKRDADVKIMAHQKIFNIGHT